MTTSCRLDLTISHFPQLRLALLRRRPAHFSVRVSHFSAPDGPFLLPSPPQNQHSRKDLPQLCLFAPLSHAFVFLGLIQSPKISSAAQSNE